jgi:uncharacterized protein YjiS (DUF1127 family)
MLHCNIGSFYMTVLVETGHQGRENDSALTSVDFLGFTILGRALNAFIAFVRAEQAAHRERSRISYELSTYSDRELAELGLGRGEIPAVAAGLYRR